MNAIQLTTAAQPAAQQPPVRPAGHRWPGRRPQIILFCGRSTASGDVSGAWIAGRGQHSAWQIDESSDPAPGRVFVSDAGRWMAGQVFNPESGFRR
jgi:hypothetical protein